MKRVAFQQVEKTEHFNESLEKRVFRLFSARPSVPAETVANPTPWEITRLCNAAHNAPRTRKGAIASLPSTVLNDFLTNKRRCFIVTNVQQSSTESQQSCGKITLNSSIATTGPDSDDRFAVTSSEEVDTQTKGNALSPLPLTSELSSVKTSESTIAIAEIVPQQDDFFTLDESEELNGELAVDLLFCPKK